MSRKKRRRNNGAENKRRENSESFHFRTSFGFSLISPFYTLFIFQNLFLLASLKRSFWLVGIKIVRRKDRRKESSTWIERKGSCHFAFSCCVHVALKNVRRQGAGRQLGDSNSGAPLSSIFRFCVFHYFCCYIFLYSRGKS